MVNAIILLATLATFGILLLPRLRGSQNWRATITPLASIIGSGFLVLGPILNHNFGVLAPVAMAVLCLIAWVFGSAIRTNIATPPEGAALGLDRASSWVLAFAYIISVAYYLNLFGSFALGLTGWQTPTAARLVTTAAFFVILLTGWTKGFSALERMEQFTVSLKLGIIAGLLAGLALVFAAKAPEAIVITPSALSGWPAVTLIFGLIVTVQGFETSRYLGDEYSARTRIRSMKLAQITATGIYLLYTALLVLSLAPGDAPLTETSIIGMMAQVAPILPAMLVAAALAAQFSAAVADTAGSGGLLAELSHNRFSQRAGYALLVGAGIALTWAADVFTIISYASRAFAAYYALQSAIAALTARQGRNHTTFALYATLALLGLAITLLGRPVE